MTRNKRNPNPQCKVVRPEGLEPPAYRFEACRSIQLSYGRTQNPSVVYASKDSKAVC